MRWHWKFSLEKRKQCATVQQQQNEKKKKFETNHASVNIMTQRGKTQPNKNFYQIVESYDEKKYIGEIISVFIDQLSS